MEIRTATIEDLPAMVDLMRRSLGEALMPKSETFFRWKHIDNPFGSSKMIVAVDQGKIIGLRTFMRWQWVRGEERISAVRAVDTATDPAYHGKGIFTKLTMQAVTECTEEGVGLVFNSPNSSSMPGYVKMGWYANGKMPLLIAPGSLFPRLYREKKVNELYSSFDLGNALKSLKHDWQIKPGNIDFQTAIDLTYLNWRYKDCPVATYGAIIEPGAFGMIFRLKKINRFLELRICDWWLEDATVFKQASSAYRKLIKKIRPVMVSCAPIHEKGNREKFKGMMGPFKKGPIITLRTLALQKLPDFNHFHHWKPSIGSMELF